MVSVIFLTHNQLEYTMQFLDSLKENFKHQKFHIIHVDNASTDGTQEYVKEYCEKNFSEFYGSRGDGYCDKCWQIRNDENQYFTKGINQGLEKFMEQQPYTKQQYCIVCNNDIVLSSYAIKNIYEDMEHYKGKIKCYIPVLYEDMDAFRENAKYHNKMNRMHNLTDTRFLGCCFALHRDLIKQIGYLDDQFNFYYSDNDYYQRILYANINIYLCMRASCFHHVNKTMPIVPEFYREIEKEKQLFYKKHGRMI